MKGECRIWVGDFFLGGLVLACARFLTQFLNSITANSLDCKVGKVTVTDFSSHLHLLILCSITWLNAWLDSFW
jgi:hypothetical protein